MDPVIYQVFNTWELVKKICSYLPWYSVYQISYLTDETKAYFQNNIFEIDFQTEYGFTGDDYIEIFKLLGKKGCERLTKIDFRQSALLSLQLLPILKYCKGLHTLGYVKSETNSRSYLHLLHNQDILEFKINSIIPNYFNDTDIMELHFLLPNLQHLEIPSTDISNASLIEISDYYLSIKYLDISDCPKITDYGLRYIFRKCVKLEAIDISMTSTFDTDAYEDLLEYNRSLIYLNAKETNLSKQSAIILHNWFKIRTALNYQFLHNSYLPLNSSINDVIRERIREEFEITYGIGNESENNTDAVNSDDDFDVEGLLEAIEAPDGEYDTLYTENFNSSHHNGRTELQNTSIGFISQISESESENDLYKLEESDYELDNDTCHQPIDLNYEINKIWTSIDRAEENLHLIEEQFQHLIDLVIKRN